MCGQVAVANLKPYRLAQGFHSVQAMEGVAFYAPAALLTKNSSKNVGDRIKIRRDAQAPPFMIVACINNEREFLGRRHLAQAVYELGAAGSTRKNGDHAGLRARPSASAAALIF